MSCVPSNLLLDDLLARLVGIGKQVQEHAAKVMRMVVGIAQLVGDGVQEQVTPFGIEVERQMLEDVHARAVRNRRRDRRRLVLQLRDAVDADVEHERVDERHVVARAWVIGLRLGRQQQARAELEQELHRRTVLEVVVEIGQQRRAAVQGRCVVAENARRLVDLGQ